MNNCENCEQMRKRIDELERLIRNMAAKWDELQSAVKASDIVNELESEGVEL